MAKTEKVDFIAGDPVSFNAPFESGEEKGRLIGWGRIIYSKQDNKTAVKIMQAKVIGGKISFNLDKPVTFHNSQIKLIDIRQQTVRQAEKKAKKEKAKAKEARIKAAKPTLVQDNTKGGGVKITYSADGQDTYFPGSYYCHTRKKFFPIHQREEWYGID